MTVEYILISMAGILLAISAVSIIVATKRLIDLIDAIKKHKISFRTYH